ncbi:TonB-dependent copper receptor [Shewanella sp. WXL01]|uniref:TonB-dependent copper receptor n=1 Tax=Shewanella sp. WXL01 TaxID=2709721 RepID=UPI00143834FE|nr:TonB-dependent copper receptor [Shewanella sp. WXL01]NKF51789.1 TonB-dependent copper receptor [Shewanella sp. WXL01]
MNLNKTLIATFVTVALTNLTAIYATAAEQKQCDTQACDDYIVVTGEVMREPSKVNTDPKKPRLPLPAYDGSGYLKTIPGFSVGRKGGAGGDPSLRGLGGSRVSIVDDGQHVYGTCGGRMDPPTAYISPESYDNISVIKGPQTVKYGPVGSAGTVLFEKERQQFTESDVTGRASATGGSFGRQDYLVELSGGDENHYIDFDANKSQSDHYSDGDGNKVQSSYDRSNFNLALGWTPDEDTLLEIAYGTSDGSAEYADRANKAREINNENLTLLSQFVLDGDLITNIEFQVYANENDHIMDQFDQGKNSGVNVRRATAGGHLWLDMSITDDWNATLGTDYMFSKHKGRSIYPTVDHGLDDLLNKPFNDNLQYNNLGVFIDSDFKLDATEKSSSKLMSGLRVDQWQTELFVAEKGKRDDTLISGFARYEYNRNNSQYYIGGGHSQRMPDYWEIMKASSADLSQKAFDLKAEKTSQIDLGWIYQNDIEFSASVYFGKVRDYILIDANFDKTVAYNVDATIWGGEAALNYPFNDNWSTQTTVSYSHGHNDTQDVALGQVSPLEGRISINYENDNWTAGLFWRLVAAQDRVSIGQGNISGQDLSESSGFGTLALNGSWKHGDAVLISFGIENIFDITYSEHISRSGAGNDIPGSEPLFKVNEPGRTAWVKLDYTF